MKHYSTYLFALYLIVIAAGCTKKSDPAPAPVLSKTELLTAHNWRKTGLTYNDGTHGTMDYFFTVPLCDRDNFLHFNPNNTVIEDEGATKCNANNPQSATYPWAFSNNETQLTFGPQYAPTTDIVQLTNTTLQLRQTNRADTYVITFTAF